MKVRKSLLILAILAGSSFLVITVLTAFSRLTPQEDLKSKYAYKDFESAKKCRSCHPGTYEQWSQSLMSQAYTHHWDEIEYFDLAVKHAEALPDLEDAVDGCNGCHTPLAFMSEKKFPPPRPS